MQIALPQASSAGPISAALRELIINVDEAGEIIVSGTRMSPDDLRSLIERAVEENPDQKVTVRGDRTTAYENVRVRIRDRAGNVNSVVPEMDSFTAGTVISWPPQGPQSVCSSLTMKLSELSSSP